MNRQTGLMHEDHLDLEGIVVPVEVGVESTDMHVCLLEDTLSVHG